MENLTFSAEILHRQRAEELQESARIERLAQEIKKRNTVAWQPRWLRRNRKDRV